MERDSDYKDHEQRIRFVEKQQTAYMAGAAQGSRNNQWHWTVLSVAAALALQTVAIIVSLFITHH